jgi:predicted nucleotidyltransferase
VSKDVLKKLRKVKPLLEEKFGVKNLSLFGSFARADETEGSDVDLLVEFKEGFETFRNYMALKDFLESQLQRPVDLVVKRALKPFLREEIEKEVINV